MNEHLRHESSPSLPPPLRVLPDMQPHWRDIDVDFDTAAEQLVRTHADDGVRHDLPIIDLRTWGLICHDGQFALRPLARHHGPKLLRSNGFTNLMGRLNAPAEFLRDRLPAPLQLAVSNYLLATPDRPITATLRLRNNEVTAIVGEKYCPIDAEALMETLREALRMHGSLSEVRVRSVATGLVDVIRIVFPSRSQAIKVGDVSAVGLDVSSSSFGRSAVHVRSMLWRLVCSNGLRVAERQGSFSFRHVGDANRMRDCIREAIPACIVHAEGTMDRWRRAVGVMVERVAELVEGMRELSHLERERVAEAIKREAGVPELPESVDCYSLLNGFTGAARDAEPARRLELESMAGELLRQHVGAV